MFGLEPVILLKTFGLIGVMVIIFAESGLFFGFFLPGGSLLFTAGFLASQGVFNIWWLTLGALVAAILGDSVGYAFGYHVGPLLFTREDSFFFRRSHLQKAKNFYDQYGRKAVALSRFVPIARTFVPILAGVARMRYDIFVTYNIIGALLWAAGVTLLGYFVGDLVPGAERYLSLIITFIIVASLLPLVSHFIRARYTKS